MRREEVVVWLVTTGSLAQPLKQIVARMESARVSFRIDDFILVFILS